MKKVYNTNFHNVYSIKYHIIFCPKYRRKVLINGIDERLKQIIPELLAHKKVSVVEMEVMPDHVHLLIDCSPKVAPGDLVASLKRHSAIILKNEFPEIERKLPALWTRGTFISSVGSVSLETVKQYIENQKGV